MNIENIRKIVREEIINLHREMMASAEEELNQEQILPSQEKTKNYCMKYGYMNTADWMATIDKLQRSFKGKLYKKK